MTEAMRQKMAEYSKRKEGMRQRDETTIEAIRWNVTRTIIERYPNADFAWTALEDHVLLKVHVQLGNCAWEYDFGHRVLEESGFAMSLGISYLLERMEYDPLRQMFCDDTP